MPHVKAANAKRPACNKALANANEASAMADPLLRPKIGRTKEEVRLGGALMNDSAFTSGIRYEANFCIHVKCIAGTTLRVSERSGGLGETRTRNQRLKRPLLYH